MLQGLDVAVETLITKSDSFLRLHSWNVIQGFITLSMDYDNNNVIKLLANIKYDIQFNSHKYYFPIKIQHDIPIM